MTEGEENYEKECGKEMVHKRNGDSIKTLQHWFLLLMDLPFGFYGIQVQRTHDSVSWIF